MTKPVIHHQTIPMTNGHVHMNGAANVCMFADGSSIVTMSAANGSAGMNFHIDATSLRALAKLLNEAVEKLPVQVEEAA